MGEAALCFSPQGDMMTTRRLFDALASGCVPVLMKSIGNAPRLWLLGSNPFHHSIDWRSIGLFLAPRSVNLGERDATGKATGKQIGDRHYPKGCRAEEAAWLDAKHDNKSLIRGLREQGRDAFRAHLDVEFHPRGVAEARAASDAVLGSPGGRGAVRVRVVEALGASSGLRAEADAGAGRTSAVPRREGLC